MRFRQLTLMLIIFLLIFPSTIKEPDNIQFYDEYALKIRSTLVKIYQCLYLLVIGLYVAAFTIISFYPQLIKRVV